MAEEKLRTLKSGGYSLMIEKDGQRFFASRAPLLGPLLEALAKHSEALVGARVIDRIVGRAAALLCAKARVSEVFTPLASKPAIEVLKQHNIIWYAARVIPHIRNHDGSDICPMERLAMSCETADEFLSKLSEPQR